MLISVSKAIRVSLEVQQNWFQIVHKGMQMLTHNTLQSTIMGQTKIITYYILCQDSALLTLYTHIATYCMQKWSISNLPLIYYGVFIPEHLKDISLSAVSSSF